MKVKVSALGMLKKFLPEEVECEISHTGMTLKELAVDIVGIPATESGICFVVNGKIHPNTETLSVNDKVVIIKMGGAG